MFCYTFDCYVVEICLINILGKQNRTCVSDIERRTCLGRQTIHVNVRAVCRVGLNTPQVCGFGPQGAFSFGNNAGSWSFKKCCLSLARRTRLVSPPSFAGSQNFFPSCMMHVVGHYRLNGAYQITYVVWCAAVVRFPVRGNRCSASQVTIVNLRYYSAHH